MIIIAASIEEIDFAHKELQRGQSLLGKTTMKEQFNDSVLFPTQINKTKSPGKAPYVCAACDSIITKRPASFCSKCKVTYYCSRECQVIHWKSGGHKKICCKAPLKGAGSQTGSRKSFVFDIEDARQHPAIGTGEGLALINYKTGSFSAAGLNKGQRSELKKNGHKVSKAPRAKNVHGDKEFIVKLQPPAGLIAIGPWMCYDGPARSFQAFVPADTTGLPEVYELLQRVGVKSVCPLTGSPGYKGYFMANWEGRSVRVFYDRVVSPQMW